MINIVRKGLKVASLVVAVGGTVVAVKAHNALEEIYSNGNTQDLEEQAQTEKERKEVGMDLMLGGTVAEFGLMLCDPKYNREDEYENEYDDEIDNEK
jgi:hypothetical protein